MTRLTADLRDAILHNAEIKAGFEDEDAALVARRVEWAEKVRVDALGGPTGVRTANRAIKRILRDFEVLPGGLGEAPRSLKTGRAYIWTNVNGMRAYAHFNGCGHGDPVYKVAPSEHVLAHDNPLVAEFETIERGADALAERRRNTLAQVRAALRSVTTVEKLLKVWPEAAELLPANLDAPRTSTDLAVCVDDLNAALRLPTEGGE